MYVIQKSADMMYVFTWTPDMPHPKQLAYYKSESVKKMLHFPLYDAKLGLFHCAIIESPNQCSGLKLKVNADNSMTEVTAL